MTREERELQIISDVQNASSNDNKIMLKALLGEMDMHDVCEVINETLNDIDRDELVAQLDDGI